MSNAPTAIVERERRAGKFSGPAAHHAHLLAPGAGGGYGGLNAGLRNLGAPRQVFVFVFFFA